VESALLFRLGEIPEGESAREVELAAAEIDLPPGGAEFVDPVRVVLAITRQGEQIHVQGRAAVRVRQACVRCLKEMTAELEAAIAVVARGRSERDPQEEPVEGLLFHDGESLDLAGEVRELLLVELPRAPACRPDCAGLCPRCGADLNAGRCGCREQAPPDGRWSTLKELRETPRGREH